jgi:cytoskeleton protein RodZ
MSEGLQSQQPQHPVEAPPPRGAVSTLRQMREAQGIELEVLAAQIKVSAAKLDALESGRYQDLPDAAFTRALAMAVCRVLKVDAAPVLATLPSARPVNLAATEPGQVPFKPTRARLNLDVPKALPWREMLSARWLVPAAVLLAALLVYNLPADLHLSQWLEREQTSAAVAAQANEADVGTPLAASTAVPTEPAASQPDGAASGVQGQDEAASAALGSAPADAALPQPGLAGQGSQTGVSPSADAAGATLVSPPSTTAAPGHSGSALVLVSTDSSWIEVRDANGEKLLSRHVTPGETIGVDGASPMKIKIGNAAGVQLTYQGNPIELAAFTRNNVARLELK